MDNYTHGDLIVRKLLQDTKKIINRILGPFGIEIIKSKNKFYELFLYPETARPELPRYVNIGAGDFYHPYWHNLDIPNDYYRELQKGRLQILHDLGTAAPLPFRDNTLKIAYCSHVLEHLSNENVKHLFSEIYRSLAPGGYFRITCPDMDLEYDAYLRRDEHFWNAPNAYGYFSPSIAQRFLDHFAGALTEAHPDKSNMKLKDAEIESIFKSMPHEAAMDNIVSRIPANMLKGNAGDHINWFNYNKTESMLTESGFKEVYKSGYGQSKSPILRNTRLFDGTCPWLSLYVECRK